MANWEEISHKRSKKIQRAQAFSIRGSMRAVIGENVPRRASMRALCRLMEEKMPRRGSMRALCSLKGQHACTM